MKAPTVQVSHFDRSITEGPVLKAVWRLAWPTMLQNIIAGLQGFVDHAMVGHFVGYQGIAAIGVSWQIFLVVVVFISSIFIGMGVLIARFAGANDPASVNRVVQQGFLTSVILSCFILAPIGYSVAPELLAFVNADPAVRAEALPYLRVMLVFNIGLLLFFMLGGALRSAGDAKTPLRLGILLTILSILLKLVLIPGVGPIPAMGTVGAAAGSVIASIIVSGIGLWLLVSGKLVVRLSHLKTWRPDMQIIRSLFRFGLPAGVQGIAMNVAGVLLLRFIGSLERSAEAQAAYTVAYTQLFSLITWSSVGLMGATAAVAGQNLGAGKPERTRSSVRSASMLGLSLASGIGLCFFFFPGVLLGAFGISDNIVISLGHDLLRVLSVSGLFVTVALAYTGGLQGTGDTRSPLYITLVSQVLIPVGICAVLQAGGMLQAYHVWLSILLGHFTRALLSWGRFRQGKWVGISVKIDRE
jgi:putative MATE family efflux protein